MVKGNNISLNTLRLNSVHVNSVGEWRRGSVIGGGGIVPLPPDIPEPDEPEPEEPTPIPTYVLSASVENGTVSASLNGKAVSLPYTANEGDVVVVEVTPNDGYVFEGWNDGSTDNPRSITMTADVALSATCVVKAVEKEYIQFADPAVEAICVANWSSDGIGLTMEDAAAVTSIGTVFYNNTEITSFDELQYFTGVTSLDESAFRNCASLTWLNLKNIVSIGVAALRGCTSLTGDYVLDKLKTINYGAFQNTAISSIVAPNVTKIFGFRDYGAFANCKSLKNAYFPLVTNVGRQAFQNCSSLETIYMPNVTSIGTYAFDLCSSLSGDIVLEHLTSAISEATFRGTSITSFVAPLLTNIGGFRDEGCFMNCKSLKSVDISSVTSIGQQAFQGCSVLADIRMDSVTYIGQQAFQSCIALLTIDIPSGVTTIGSYAFYKSSSLESIICRPTTPPTLADTYALQNTNNCPIYVPDASVEAYRTATNWSSYADRIHPLSEIEGSPYIQFADANVESVLIANGVSSDGIGITKADAEAVTSIGTWFTGNTAIVSFDELQFFTGLTDIYGVYPNGAFINCTSLQSIRIPEGVTSIEGQAFANCTALDSVTFPNTLISVKWEAFNKAALTNLDLILDNVTTIGEAAFRQTGLRSVVLPRIVTITSSYGSAGMSNTFAVCANLQYALLGNSCANVGNWGCFQDSAITTLICLATTPPSGGSICDNTPISKGSGYIYVPDASVDAYKATASDGWAKYSSRIKGISSLATDNPTLYEEIKDYLS